jgi:hypothetical protein
LPGGVEFFDFEAFEDVLDELVALFDHLCVFILGLCFVCQFVAVCHAVCDFEQFLCDFGDSEVLAFLDLPA